MSVVPKSGVVDNFRTVKVVDRSNVFSRCGVPKRTYMFVESTVFQPPAPDAPQPKSSSTRSPNYTDPFADSRDQVKCGGVKMVTAANVPPRSSSKKVAGYKAPLPILADNRAFTSLGTPYGGRVTYTADHKESDTDAYARSQQRSMERFRKTQVQQSNVMRPETLSDIIPKEKPQRFISSTKYTQPTLQGVLTPSPAQPAAAYRVVAPWHTS